MGEEKGREERVINLPDKCETAPYAPKIAVALSSQDAVLNEIGPRAQTRKIKVFSVCHEGGFQS